MNSMTKDRSNAVAQSTATKKFYFSRGFSLDPLKVAIARLSDSDFARMDREDLIYLVSNSVLDSLSMESQARLDFVDDMQLKRLAYLARLACQRNVNSAFFECGRTCPFFAFN